MDTLDPAGLYRVAADCVALISTEYGTRLDCSVESLATLDEVCATILADGPLSEQHRELWRELIGAYTGEVLLRTYGGQWVMSGNAPAALAVSVGGITAFPFAVADRVLRGEPYKSLASFARALPAVLDQAQRSPPVPGSVEGQAELPRLTRDPAKQLVIDEQILAGHFADAIAATREAYGSTMNDAFHEVLARKRELGA
ncbi:MAG: hypothetical protein J2P15_02035 [Micromonosporaceae bacterium]|nr:hypothetical protein [Micromonosporaceae bacterium]